MDVMTEDPGMSFVVLVLATKSESKEIKMR